MEIQELKSLVRYADTAQSNAEFWRKLYYAAFAYDINTRMMLHGFIAANGILPDDVPGQLPISATNGRLL